MALVDFEASYKSKPPSQQPDPFVNFVDPYSGGSTTSANAAAWAPTQTTAAPQPYNPVAPPPQHKWNDQFETWEDADGNLWDRDTGLWYDPNTQNVWQSGVIGWQSIPEYNDYTQSLIELYGTSFSPGGFAANALIAQPSLFKRPQVKPASQAEWFNADAARDPSPSAVSPEQLNAIFEHEALTPYPSVGENINTLSGTFSGGYTRNEAASLPDSEAARRAQALTNVRQDWQRQEAEGLTLGGLLGKGISAYNKYIANPIAETGAQLTPAALEASRFIPFASTANTVANLAGYNTQDAAKKGLGELGTALSESGGNPLTFAQIQNEKLAKRPAWQQMAASVAYDPTNLVGMGLASEALKSAKASGLAGDLLRGAGAANEAIDLATSRLGREVLGFGAGAIGNALAGEDTTGLNWWQAGALGALGGSATRGTGSLGAKAAESLARAQGRAGLDPVLGLSLDILKGPEARNTVDAIRKAADNPSLAVEIDAIRQATGSETVEDFLRVALQRGPEGKRLRKAILGAAQKEGVPVGGALQEVTGVTAKAAGKAAVPAIGGTLGYLSAPDDASPMERLAYTLGGAAAALGGEFAIDRVLPRLTRAPKAVALDLDKDAPIAVGLNRPEALPLRTKVGNALKNKLFMGHFSDDPRVAGIARDYELGRSLVPSQANVFAESVDARLRSVFEIDKNGRIKGLPYIDEAGEVIGDGPDLQQVAAVLPHYLDKLTRAQLDALDYARAAVDHIASVRGAVDLDPLRTARGVIGGGFYLPRGKSVGEGVDEVRAIPISRGKTGGEVSTEKGRKFGTKREGEEAGREYVPLVEALRNYATEQLAKAWDHAAAQQLIETGLGIPPVAKLSPEVEAEIKAIRAEMKEASSRAAGLENRLNTERRIGRFTTRELRAIDRRVEELKRQALNRSTDMTARREAAREASALARTQLSDSLASALDAAESAGRADQKLTDLIARAQKQERRMAALEQELRANAGLGEVTAPGVRLPAVTATGKAADDAVMAASAATEAGRKLARELRGALREGLEVPVGPAAASATDSARAALETARAARKAAQEALEKARKEAQLGPDERIAAIEAEARALARREKDLTERAQATGIRTQAIEDELDGIRQQQAVAKAKIDGLKAAVARTRADAATAREGMTQIDLVPLAGYHWPTSVANTFNKRIPRPGRKYLSVEAYDAINDTLRSLEATGDASAVGIQLAKLGYSHPGIVAKAAKAAIQAMNDPGALGKYILDADLDAVAKGEPLVETMAKYGVRFDTGEITTSAHGRTTLTRAIENSPILGRGVLEPSNRVFDNSGNFARIDLFKTLYRTWGAAGMDVDSPEVMKALAKATNLATGYSRNSVLGGPIGSRILFAGRFFKSQLDTVGDAVTKAGIEGTIARQQIARMLGIGTMLTIAANEARGYKTELRPWEPNFMRIRDVQGHDVSLFGPWDSLVRGMITDDWNQFEHWRDFGRSKAGPVVASVWDLWEGKTYIGDAATTRLKVGDTSLPAPKPLWAAEKLTPFGLANAIDEFVSAARGDKPFAEAIVGAAAQFVGLKSSPLTGYERQLASMNDAWEDYAPTGYAKPGSMQDDPLFVRKWTTENAEKLAGPTTETGKQLKVVEAEFKKKNEANDAAAVAGKGIGPDGKEIDWTIGDWKGRRRELQIEKRRALMDILGDKDREPAKEGTPAYWLQTYFETFDKAETDLGLDFEALDRAQAEWLTRHGDKALDYVNEYLQTGKSDIERDYLKAMAQLNKDGYFEIPKYIGMVSDLPESEIDRLRALVTEKSADPKYAPFAGAEFKDRAAIILIDVWKEQGKSLKDDLPVLIDVVNAGKKAHQNPRRLVYRIDHPELVEWLDNSNHYETLKALAEAE